MAFIFIVFVMCGAWCAQKSDRLLCEDPHSCERYMLSVVKQYKWNTHYADVSSYCCRYESLNNVAVHILNEHATNEVCPEFFVQEGHGSTTMCISHRGRKITCYSPHLKHDDFGQVFQVKGSCQCGSDDSVHYGTVTSCAHRKREGFCMLKFPQHRAETVPLIDFALPKCAPPIKERGKFSEFSVGNRGISITRFLKTYDDGTQFYVRALVVFNKMQEAVVSWGVHSPEKGDVIDKYCVFVFPHCPKCEEKMEVS